MENTGPVRTCTGCRRRRTQAELMRVAVGRDGEIVVDRPGARDRTQGRGAYICPDPECIRRALRTGGVARALKADRALPEDLMSRLLGRIGGAGSV